MYLINYFIRLFIYMCIFVWFLLDWHDASLVRYCWSCFALFRRAVCVFYIEIFWTAVLLLWSLAIHCKVSSFLVMLQGLSSPVWVFKLSVCFAFICNCPASFAYSLIFSLLCEQGKWVRLIYIYWRDLLVTVFRKLSLTCKCVTRATLAVHSTVPKTL